MDSDSALHLTADQAPRGDTGRRAVKEHAMTTPAPAPLDSPEPGWRQDGPLSFAGPCFQRYVEGKGVVRVVPGSLLNSLTGIESMAEGYAWYLSAGADDVLTIPEQGFAAAGDAIRDADQHAGSLPPGMFEHLDPERARRLYFRLTRATDLGITRRGYDPDLVPVLRELFTHIKILALNPDYEGPSPWEIRELARKWREIAARSGLRDSDFSQTAALTGGQAAAYIGHAAEQLTAGRPEDADQALQRAASACEMTADGLRQRGIIEDLRRRMNEATATDLRGEPILPFARVTIGVPYDDASRLPGHGQPGVVETVSSQGERMALVFPEGHHLEFSHGRVIAYNLLEVHGYGPDPVTPAAAKPYASLLPPGITLDTADRYTLASVIRRGLTDRGQLRNPVPLRVQGEFEEGPGRNDSAAPGLAGGPGFPDDLANGVSSRTADAQPATKQASRQGAPRRTR
jgi:hypothetical protein